MKVKIIDSICGSGKTSYAIQMINECSDTGKFIYITPFLDEVERVKKSCDNFISPQYLGTSKFDHFHKLLIQGKNIVSTHALFRMATQETKDLIEGNGYTLILDEVMDVLEELPLRKNDLPTILSTGLAHKDENDFLIWDQSDYDGRYNDVKTMCENKSIFVVNDCCLMWTFPIEVFESFSEVYVLTYMFSSQLQRYYYDLYDLPYEYYRVQKKDCGYTLVSHDGTVDVFNGKINIYYGSMNNIGDGTYDLSVGWYDKHKYTKVKILKNNIYNYFFNVVRSKGKYNLWTTFSDYESKLRGKGYTSGFLAHNSRSTNNYIGKTTIAYCVNKFISPMVVHFFKSKGVTIDQDKYALSELIQFVWRSAIRRNQEINIYIPSKRMRNMLEVYTSECKVH